MRGAVGRPKMPRSASEIGLRAIAPHEGQLAFDGAAGGAERQRPGIGGGVFETHGVTHAPTQVATRLAAAETASSNGPSGSVAVGRVCAGVEQHDQRRATTGFAVQFLGLQPPPPRGLRPVDQREWIAGLVVAHATQLGPSAQQAGVLTGSACGTGLPERHEHRHRLGQHQHPGVGPRRTSDTRKAKGICQGHAGSGEAIFATRQAAQPDLLADLATEEARSTRVGTPCGGQPRSDFPVEQTDHTVADRPAADAERDGDAFA